MALVDGMRATDKGLLQVDLELRRLLMPILAFACIVTFMTIQDHMRAASYQTVSFDSFASPVRGSANTFSAAAEALADSAEPDWDEVIRLTRISIEKNPRRLENWNRIVFAEASASGYYTDEVAAAFDQGFFLSPYGPLYLMQWRLEFANLHWANLSPATRALVKTQISAIYPHRRGRRWLRTFNDSANPELQQAIAERLGTRAPGRGAQ